LSHFHWLPLAFNGDSPALAAQPNAWRSLHPNLSLQQVTKEKEKGDFGGIDPLTVPQLF